MMKTQNEQFFSIYNFLIESARIQINFLSGDVSSLCDAWENKKTKAFYGDRDQIVLERHITRNVSTQTILRSYGIYIQTRNRM